MEAGRNQAIGCGFGAAMFALFAFGNFEGMAANIALGAIALCVVGFLVFFFKEND